MNEGYRYLFGPVRSRRLGRSLGLDLVPFKVCSFDCPYCQVGGTTTQTLDRAEYVPLAGVLAEFDHWLSADGNADHLTLAGAGEPTLHLRFGEILEALADRTAIPRVLLSNGSLFHLEEVRVAARRATIVKGTLAAWDQPSFEALHHPHPSLVFTTFLRGLQAMRAEFSGEYWLEVFLVAGVNDAPEQVARIAALAKAIRPDRIHLNTAVRPPQAADLRAVSVAQLATVANAFTPVAELSVSSPHPPATGGRPPREAGELEGMLLGLIQRHPCTAADIAISLGVDPCVVARLLAGMEGCGTVRAESRQGSLYYAAV